jgi:hypothetical protein
MRLNNFVEVAAVNRKRPEATDGNRTADSPEGTGYSLENAAAQAGERFVALSALFDIGTIRSLEDHRRLFWAAWGRRPQRLGRSGESQIGPGIHFRPDDEHDDPLAIMW